MLKHNFKSSWGFDICLRQMFIVGRRLACVQALLALFFFSFPQFSRNWWACSQARRRKRIISAKRFICKAAKLIPVRNSRISQSAQVSFYKTKILLVEKLIPARVPVKLLVGSMNCSPSSLWSAVNPQNMKSRRNYSKRLQFPAQSKCLALEALINMADETKSDVELTTKSQAEDADKVTEITVLYFCSK